jgi:hypothetical protein
MIAGDDKHHGCYVVTETIFAGKNVKEFSFKNIPAGFGISRTIFSWLFEDLLMCNSPGYACHRNGQDE